MEGMEWAGGMTPMQLQIQVEHERRVEALLEKAIAEDDAKRAAKAAAKSAKKQAAAARRHQRVRRSASSTSVCEFRGHVFLVLLHRGQLVGEYLVLLVA